MHWRRKWQPTPVFLPGESQGREAWWAAVYGVATESDTTEATQQLDALWRRQWHPTLVLLPRKSHGWRSLGHYSPWGRKELDTTERLHFVLDSKIQALEPFVGPKKE